MLFSVVVTVVDGGATLTRCLDALASQQDAPPLEVLVPYDATAPGVPAVCAPYAFVRTIDMGAVKTDYPPLSLAGQHDLFDRRRSAGLGAATGELIALLEDRGAPRPDWAAAYARLHARLPNQVIGGPVDNGRDDPLAWAVFLSDFGRYQPPLAEGPRDYVTDVNLCYKREALEATRTIWATRFHETTVHWQLQRNGVVLYLSPEPVVVQRREGLTLFGLLKERYAWARLFGYTRARESSFGKRLVYAASTPLLPSLLFFRIARRQHQLPSYRSFQGAAPALFLLLTAWSLGEGVGVLTGRA